MQALLSSDSCEIPGKHWILASLFWAGTSWLAFGLVAGATRAFARRLLCGVALVHFLEAILAAYLARRRGLPVLSWLLKGLYLGAFAWTRLLR